eukprot:SAG31_NODE_205_length_20397_cov_19.191152_2_plen_124_part_00
MRDYLYISAHVSKQSFFRTEELESEFAEVQRTIAIVFLRKRAVVPCINHVFPKLDSRNIFDFGCLFMCPFFLTLLISAVGGILTLALFFATFFLPVGVVWLRYLCEVQPILIYPLVLQEYERV